MQRLLNFSNAELNKETMIASQKTENRRSTYRNLSITAVIIYVISLFMIAPPIGFVGLYIVISLMAFAAAQMGRSRVQRIASFAIALLCVLTAIYDVAGAIIEYNHLCGRMDFDVIMRCLFGAAPK